MKNDHIFIIASVCFCLVLLSAIYYGVAFYEVIIDWDSISGIILGAYFYFVYLIIGIFYGRPTNRMRYFQERKSQQRKQRIYTRDAYEY
ncbi:hypothetical protein [Nitrosomonas sp. Nm166]|uniref:hypothetical protein n=1 Tax=Nitrosomonas sp. Nm166 TaxID=1881054 RepID=UPI0008DFADF6|nr:hypothetical protein [Nitrosomonas sp. Nm166]SFE19277.1 hypothetical protein SAMN05428977_100913 [Nitrosomonas sp. Nm166]